MLKTTTIKISRDGHAVVDTDGFKGVGCADASRAIEVALGGAVAGNSKDDKKGDFYISDSLPVHQSQM